MVKETVVDAGVMSSAGVMGTSLRGAVLSSGDVHPDPASATANAMMRNGIVILCCFIRVNICVVIVRGGQVRHR